MHISISPKIPSIEFGGIKEAIFPVRGDIFGCTMIDIREMPDVIERLNAALNNHEIVEVKIEPKGVSVVTIHRAVKLIIPVKGDATN